MQFEKTVFAFWELTPSKTGKEDRKRILPKGYTKQILKANDHPYNGFTKGKSRCDGKKTKNQKVKHPLSKSTA